MADVRAAIAWQIAPAPVDYPLAMTQMAQRVRAVQQKQAEELVWLLEHPPLYTLGTSAKRTDLLAPGALPVYESGRGGQITYHGPGQRIAYVVRDLKAHAAARGESPDLRAYVRQLENWLILTLHAFGVHAFTREGRVGLWVETPRGECKIAALGVRVQQWVTSHGIALNVTPDLSHYRAIVPCGIRDYGVTSLADLGLLVETAQIDAALKTHWHRVFD